MANNVTLPAVGTGDTNPKASTDQVTADSSHVQNVQIATVSAGVLSRVSASNPLGVAIVGTVPISAAALPLPTGAATQTTLASVLSALGTPLQAGGNVAVTGTVPLPTGAATETTLAAVNTKLGASLPLPTGAATETTLAAVNTKLGASLPLPTGAATETTLAAVNTKLGSALPLPTGAATQTTLASLLAKTPSLGTAGTGSTDVITVQGNASGTPIPVSGSFAGTTDLTASGSITASAQTVSINPLNGMATVVIDVSGTFVVTLNMQGTVDGTNWANIVGARNPLDNTSALGNTSGITAAGRYQLPIAGLLGIRILSAAYVSGTAVVSMRASAGQSVITLGSPLPAGSSSIGSIAAITNALPAGSSIIGALVANQSVNAAQINGVTPLMGNGISGTGAQRVTIASDSTGQVTLAAGAAAIGSVTTEFATGLTTFANTALTNTKTAVKAGAGKVHGWMIHNPSAATTFVQVWNVAIGSITVGTTAPTWVIPIPAGASANVFSEKGITHSTEINIAATTTAAGASAPATAAVVSLFYV